MSKENQEKEPVLSALEQELERERYKVRYFRVLRSTIYGLITIVAIVLLLATIIFPVLHCYGNAMEPTIYDGEIVMAYKAGLPKKGQVIATYFDNKILIRRVIGEPGDQIDIKKDGALFVNGERVVENYLSGMHLGDTDIEYPYSVPEGRYFVMGDNRAVAIDSRNSVVGCIAEEELIGKIFLRIWPLADIGFVS